MLKINCVKLQGKTKLKLHLKNTRVTGDVRPEHLLLVLGFGINPKTMEVKAKAA